LKRAGHSPVAAVGASPASARLDASSAAGLGGPDRSPLIQHVLSFLNNAFSLFSTRYDAFMKIDKDGNGKISFEEWRGALGQEADEHVLKEVFSEIDKNGDGHLTVDEFEESFSRIGKR